MANDEGIREIGRGRFQVRVKRIDQRTGRQVNRKSTVTGTRADARRVRDERRSELGSTVAKRARIRLSEFAASWLEQRAAGGLKASTLRRYGYSLKHIVPALGDIYLDAIAPSDVAAYVAMRAKADSGYTVLNELRCLRTMAKDSVGEGYVDRDWCDRVRAPSVSHYTKARPNLLNAKQFSTLLKKLPQQWRGLILFMATTGLRWGEASALHWEDVDLKIGEATITRSNDRGTETTPKNLGSLRSVPALPHVVKLWGKPRATGLVFPAASGDLHRGWPLIKVLTNACELAKVPRVTAHGLRRTFNNLARQKASREVLKSITGHTTDAMVEHYSFVDHREKKAASRVVARSMGIQR